MRPKLLTNKIKIFFLHLFHFKDEKFSTITQKDILRVLTISFPILSDWLTLASYVYFSFVIKLLFTKQKVLFTFMQLILAFL